MMTNHNQFINSAARNELHGNTQVALLLYWVELRKKIFTWLDTKQIRYSSTEEALLEFFRNCDSVTISDFIYEVYHITILLEYDNTNNLDTVLLQRSLASAKAALQWFDGSVRSLALGDFSLLSEIDAHIDDCRWSMTSHFIAADTFESLHNRLVNYPLILGSAMLAFMNTNLLENTFRAYVNNVSSVAILAEIVAILVLSLSLLNASINWQYRGQRHRNAANKYLSIRRDARQIKVEIETFPKDARDMRLFIERMNVIKSSLNSAAQEAPQIPIWAFRKARRRIHGAQPNWIQRLFRNWHPGLSGERSIEKQRLDQ